MLQYGKGKNDNGHGFLVSENNGVRLNPLSVTNISAIKEHILLSFQFQGDSGIMNIYSTSCPGDESSIDCPAACGCTHCEFEIIILRKTRVE